MRSISFAGHDFGAYTSCEVVVQGFSGYDIESEIIEGRVGELVVERRMKPLEIQVKLLLDAKSVKADEVSGVRRQIAAWLSDCPGILILPSEPDLEYHNVECTGTTLWNSDKCDATCTVTFIAYDPVAYGESHTVTASGTTVDVTNSGTWASSLLIALTVASDCTDLSITDGSNFILLSGTFKTGDELIVNTDTGLVTLNETQSPELIQLGSVMFWCEPGNSTISCEQVSEISVTLRDRWV